jgi:enterochelin esterase family protein
MDEAGGALAELRVEDPEQRYAAVRLCSDLRLAEPEFESDGGCWVLRLPPMRLERLEYQLEVTYPDGGTEVVCDPGNPLRAPGVFGEKSVALAASYTPPDWLEWPALEGALEHLPIRVQGRDLEVAIWSPDDGELPLLVAHDGPEYAELALLLRYAGAVIDQGALGPFRVALLPPGDRDEWYSASAIYGRALSHRVMAAVRQAVPVSGLPVGMGASLGALAMLQAARAWPRTFAGLFLQSGSFFVPRLDSHESGFPRYGRIVRFVREVLRARSHPEPVATTMTCGAEEENIHNNRLIVAALHGQGYDARLHEGTGLHDYTSWRDLLHPHLTDLLARAWGAGADLAR